MITITLLDKRDERKYRIIRCPVCKHRICDKPIGTKICVDSLEGKEINLLNHIVIICKRCKLKYIVTIEKK